METWPDGLQAQAVLTNTSTSPVSGWTLIWSLTGDQRVSDLWNGDFTQVERTWFAARRHSYLAWAELGLGGRP
jgi:Cellulose binding domain